MSRKRQMTPSDTDPLQRPKLTDRQQKVFDFLVASIDKNGYPPTLREIGEHMNIRSTNGVSDHLKALERKGYVKKNSLRARALSPIVARSTQHKNSTLELPVVGKVAAGVPIPRVESCERTIILDASLVNGQGDMFVLEVTGDSMINDGIHEGDYLIIRKQPDANNGDIVVAVIDDEVTVKRFYREAQGIRLQPANDALRPILLSPNQWEEVSVLGISVGLYRKY